MPMSLFKVTGALIVASLFCSVAAAQQASTLTAQDRADIQALVSKPHVAPPPGPSQAYASLFVPDGVFISDDFRGKRHREMYGPNGGKLVGRAKIAELVETEEFCIDRSQARAGGNRPAPNVTITVTPQGVKGTIPLGNGGRYDDEYVKTSEGWRFKT